MDPISCPYRLPATTFKLEYRDTKRLESISVNIVIQAERHRMAPDGLSAVKPGGRTDHPRHRWRIIGT